MPPIRMRASPLIAGGYERQQDYAHLAERIGRTDNVALVVCLPDTGARLAGDLRQRAPSVTCLEAPDLTSAMQAIATRRHLIDTVLLSPGAPSYNQFRNFGERGDAFIALAHKLFG